MSTTDEGNKVSTSHGGSDRESKSEIASGENKQSGLCPPSDLKEDEGNNNKRIKKYRIEMKICANHLLREVRVEIQEVSRIIDEHIAGQLDIVSHKDILQTTKEEVSEKMNDLKNTYLNKLPPVDYYSEVINIWQLIETSPVFDSSKIEPLSENTQNLLRELTLLKNRISRLSFLVVYITGKERLNNWIDGARPGYALPFHRIFEDEIGAEDDRQRILNLYSLQPEALNGGLIDPVKGVVLCYPSSKFDRLLRHILLLLFLVVSFVAVYGFASLLTDEGVLKGALEIPKEPTVSFLIMSWSALLIGILGHVLITGAKVTNVEYRQFPLPLRDWGFYLSSRTAMIVYKITLALFVFLSMFVLLEGEMKLLEAFLIGYGFDSVIDLVGVSLEKRSSVNIKVLKEKIG